MGVEFRIMGVPSRREKFILPMLEQLGLSEDIVSYDFKMERNPLKSAKRVWLKPTNESHICVLQDDIVMCDNFVEIVNKCADKFPRAVFSFYNPRLRPEDANEITPYVRVVGSGMYGPAIMIPSILVPIIFEWGDKNYGTNFTHDDIVIGFFCEINKVPVMTTNPSIIQHLGHNESTLGYNNKKKVSKIFCQHPSIDLFDVSAYVKSKRISNTKIEPKGGYPLGRLVPYCDL